MASGGTGSYVTPASVGAHNESSILSEGEEEGMSQGDISTHRAGLWGLGEGEEEEDPQVLCD